VGACVGRGAQSSLSPPPIPKTVRERLVNSSRITTLTRPQLVACLLNEATNKRTKRVRERNECRQLNLQEHRNLKAWFPYGRNGHKKRVTIFLNGQFIIVYTCKPHINHKYSLVIITPRIFNSKMLYFSWWERSWLNLYDRYDHMETRLKLSYSNCLGCKYGCDYTNLKKTIPFYFSICSGAWRWRATPKWHAGTAIE
jgi:hypothetical protein